MPNHETVAVLGSGNGGHAVAAILALAGHRVRLYGRHGFREKLLAVRSQGGITLSGVAGSGLVRLEAVTNSIEEALAGANLVVVAAPATTHEEVADLCARHFVDGQVVLLLQGMAGTLLFSRAIREANSTQRVMLGETATLPYTCRLVAPGHVHVSRVSRRHLSAAFPGSESAALAQRLRPLFPFLVPATHVLETTLYNPNPILHPPGTLLNLGRIEHVNGEFRIYEEGFTASVWTLVHALDAEKMALLRALGLPAVPYLEEFAQRNDDSFEQFAAQGIKGPSGAHDRYITEDVPAGLVLFSSLGQTLGIPTPVSDALIRIASAINATDYRATGRTLDRLGLGGLSPERLGQHLVSPHAA